MAELPDWGQILSELPPEQPPIPAPPVPSIELPIQVVEPEPPTAPLQPSAPSGVLPPEEPPVAVAAAPELEVPTPAEALPYKEPPYMEAGDYGPSIQDDPAQLTAQSGGPSLPGTKTPPPETPLPVLLLVDQAQSATGQERQELSRRVNRWLDEMVREGGSRHVADWFHHLIENGRLEGLADAAGHSCHETAVRGLLAMGFPYALEVRPEDLARLQPRPPPPQVRKRKQDLNVGAAGVVAGGAVTELVLNLLRLHPTTGLLTVEVGLALLATVAVLFGRSHTPTWNMGLSVLLVVSALSFFLAVFGGYAGLVSGLAGLVAALLFALHRS